MEQTKKKRLLICGNSLSTYTGFSYVAKSILSRFYYTGNYEVQYATLAGPNSSPKFFGIWGDKFSGDFQGLPTHDIQVHDQNTYKQFDKVIEDYRPDLVIVINDVWMMESIILSSYRYTFNLFLYITIETPFYPEWALFPTLFDQTGRKSLKNLYQRADLVIPVTKMGKQALHNMGVVDNVSDNVYNGLDFDKRYITRLSKQQAYGNVVSNSDFVFFCVSDNSDRKILDKTIYSFKTFLDKIPENEKLKYKFYLHTNFLEIKGGTDIISLIENLKLHQNVLLPRNFVDQQFISTEQLYSRYATADCYLALTGGEGFGYGVAESLMHKLPVVYIDYGGYTEFMQDFGYPVKVQTYINAKNIDVKWALADIDDAANQMLYVVNNYSEAKQKAELGFKWAQNNLDWDTIIFPKMLKIIEDKMENSYKPKVLMKQII